MGLAGKGPLPTVPAVAYVHATLSKTFKMNSTPFCIKMPGLPDPKGTRERMGHLD